MLKKNFKVIGQYQRVSCPEHPRATNGHVYEHVLIVERQLRRYLKKGEHVHHRNGNCSDNRIRNLQLVSHGEHMRLHRGADSKLCRKIWVLYQKGGTMRSVAKRLGIPYWTVYGALKSLGELPGHVLAGERRKSTPEKRRMRQKVLTLNQRGWPYRLISKKLGISTGRIRYILRCANTPKRVLQKYRLLGYKQMWKTRRKGGA